MTRPDLDAIAHSLANHYEDQKIAGSWTGAMYADMNTLLTYCRELEAEAKLLRGDHIDAVKAFNDIAGWLATGQHRKAEDLANWMPEVMGDVQP